MIVHALGLFYRGLECLFRGEPGIEVVASESAPSRALFRARDASPDVVLLDGALAGGKDLRLIGALAGVGTRPRLVVLAGLNGYPPVGPCLVAGASGYVPLQATFEEVVRTVRAAAEGGVYIHPSAARRLTSSIRHPHARDPGPQLQDHEIRALERLAAGASLAELAVELGISDRTLRRYSSTLFGKLQAQSYPHAVAEAIRRGIIV